MGFLALLVINVLIMAISIYFSPRPEIRNARPTSYNELRFPTTDRKRPRPMLCGKTEVKSAQILWSGNYKAVPIKEEIDGGLFHSDKEVTVGYDYYLSLMLGLCLGPVEAFGNIRVNDRVARESEMTPIPKDGFVEFECSASEQTYWGRISSGTRNQPPCGDPKKPEDLAAAIDYSFLFFSEEELETLVTDPAVVPDRFGSPEDPNTISPFNLTYPGLCYLNVHGHLGESPQLKDIKIELQRLPKVLWPAGHYDTTPTHDLNGDANIAECIWDIIQNDEGGLSRSIQEYDRTSFQVAAQTLYEEDLGVSFLWDTATTGDKMVEQLLSYADGLLRLDPDTGLYQLKLIREDYNPATVPSFDEDEIFSVVSASKQMHDKAVNSITVQYKDRALHYEDNSFTIKDIGGVLDSGREEHRTLDFPWATRGSVASTLGYRELRVASLSLESYKLIMNRRAYGVRVGDVIRITYTAMDIISELVRVTRVDNGNFADGSIEVSVVQDRFATEGAVFGDGSSGEPANPDPVLAAPVKVFMEYAPYALTNAEGVRSGLAVLKPQGEGASEYRSYHNDEFSATGELYAGVKQMNRPGIIIHEVAGNEAHYDTIAVIGEGLEAKHFTDLTSDPGRLDNLFRIGNTWGSFLYAEKVFVGSLFSHVLLHGVTMGRLSLASQPYPPGAEIHFISRGFDTTPGSFSFSGSFDDWRLRAIPVSPDGAADEANQVTFNQNMPSEYDTLDKPYVPYKLTDFSGNWLGPYPYALTVDTGLEAEYEFQELVWDRLFNAATLPTLGQDTEGLWYIREAYSWDGVNYSRTLADGTHTALSGTANRIGQSLAKATYHTADVAPEYLVFQVYAQYSSVSTTLNYSPATGWARVDPETIGFHPDDTANIPRGGIFYQGADLYSIGLKGTRSGPTAAVIMKSTDNGNTWVEEGTSANVKWLTRIEPGEIFGKSRDSAFLLSGDPYTVQALIGRRATLPLIEGTTVDTTDGLVPVNHVAETLTGDYLISSDLAGVGIRDSAGLLSTSGVVAMGGMGDILATQMTADGDYISILRAHTYEEDPGIFTRWGMTHDLRVIRYAGIGSRPEELSELVTGGFVRDAHLEKIGSAFVLMFAEKTGDTTYTLRVYTSADDGETWTPVTLTESVYRQPLVVVKVFGKLLFTCGDTVFATDGITMDETTSAVGPVCGLGLMDSSTAIKVVNNGGTIEAEWSIDGITWVGANNIDTLSGDRFITLNGDWFTVLPSGGSGDGGGDGQVGASYWRLYVTDTDSVGSFKVQINEVEFRSSAGLPETPSGGTAFGSSQVDPGGEYDKAFDGSDSTLWSSESGALLPQSIGYDFGVEKSVEEVYILASTDSFRLDRLPKSFEVQSSLDGVNWTTELVVTDEPAWSSGESRTYAVIAPVNWDTVAIGDEVGGGIYAGTYKLPAGDGRYLHTILAKAEDEGSAMQWKTTNNDTPGADNSNDGLENTLAIEVAGLIDHPAAEYCVDYAAGGRNDWYLPATNELKEAWLNVLGEAEYATLVSEGHRFWTSTEWITSSARVIRGNDAFVTGDSKTASYYVLPMRREANLPYIGTGGWVQEDGGTTSLNPAYPEGLQENDLLLLVVTNRETLTVPAEWTLVRTETAADAPVSQEVQVYQRVVPAGGLSGTITITQASSGRMNALIMGFRRSDGTTPSVEATTGLSDQSVPNVHPIDFAPITPSVGQGCVVAINSFIYRSTSAGAWSDVIPAEDWSQPSPRTWGSTNDAPRMVVGYHRVDTTSEVTGSVSLYEGGDDPQVYGAITVHIQ